MTTPLDRIHCVELIPTAPFDFDSTFHKPDHFTTGDNAWEPGTRWQTCAWRGARFGLKFSDAGSTREPAIQVDVYTNDTVGEAVLSSLFDELRYRYTLDLNLGPFYRAFAGDAVLGPVIQCWQGMRPGHPSSLYEYLIIGIVLQNATIRRSMQMFEALLQSYGALLEFDGRRLWCFWEPGALRDVSEEALRALKVGYRARTIKRIDDQFLEGRIDEAALREQDRETQMRALLELYGVGPATAWYLLFDVFHRWDFFNHVSPWEQKIYSKLFFDRDPEDPLDARQILEHFECYGVYKQLAVHYVWEDLWWRHAREPIPWLAKLIRA